MQMQSGFCVALTALVCSGCRDHADGREIAMHRDGTRVFIVDGGDDGLIDDVVSGTTFAP